VKRRVYSSGARHDVPGKDDRALADAAIALARRRNGVSRSLRNRGPIRVGAIASTDSTRGQDVAGDRQEHPARNKAVSATLAAAVDAPR
jgi:hypothetical protein